MEHSHQPYTFDRVIRIIFTAICVIASLWCINYLSGVLLPFVVACLVAYILNPFVEFNRKIFHLKGRVVATLMTLLEVVIIIAIACSFLIPYIVSEIQDLIVMLKSYNQTEFSVPFLPQQIHDYIKENINIQYLSSLLSHEEWMKLISKTANETWSFLGSTLSVIFAVLSWVVVLLYLVFILIDFDKVMGGFKHAVPSKYRKTTYKIFRDVKISMNRYFRGQALISFIVGILFSIGFVIVGLPMGIVLGLFIGLLNMVPYLQLISLPIAAILCLVDSVATGGNFWVLAGEVFIVYCVVQAIQDLYLTPRIMGKYMGLNPAIIFLSLSIWGTILGFIGLIIALPLTTLLIAYYDEYILHIGHAPENSDKESQSTPKASE